MCKIHVIYYSEARGFNFAGASLTPFTSPIVNITLKSFVSCIFSLESLSGCICTVGENI